MRSLPRRAPNGESDSKKLRPELIREIPDWNIEVRGDHRLPIERLRLPRHTGD